MADIIIPQAGESVTSGVVLRWTKKVGEYVKRDETILELETDKATLEVPAPVAGVLTAQAVKEGDTVKIGASVGSIDEKAAAPAGAVSPAFRARVMPRSPRWIDPLRAARAIPLRPGRPGPCSPRSRRRAGPQRSAAPNPERR